MTFLVACSLSLVVTFAAALQVMMERRMTSRFQWGNRNLGERYGQLAVLLALSGFEMTMVWGAQSVPHDTAADYFLLGLAWVLHLVFALVAMPLSLLAAYFTWRSRNRLTKETWLLT